MDKSILFLTDLDNGEKEDPITVEYLKKYFDVTISYFDTIESHEKNFSLILLRNTWPSDHSKVATYHKLKTAFLHRAETKNLNIYNDSRANADHLGKGYLVTLYKNNFPVIPSVDSLEDLKLLPRAKQYLLKPKNGFSSIGIETIARERLSETVINNQIIQPKLDFQYEISFYFIDKKFLYCLIFAPSKIPAWPRPTEHEPTAEELRFAKQCLDWEKMRYGLCRVDALKTTAGKLVLLEIEDDAPYFSITEIAASLKKLFLESLKESIQKVIGNFYA